jgi:FMN phosphatase YigB (HAD superfamily)
LCKGPEGKRGTIFVDLDDTLVNTFDLLIAPLERRAAATICKNHEIPFTAEELTSILLELRRKNPARIKSALGRRLGSKAAPISEIRDRILSDFSVEPLAISEEAIQILKTLARDYDLVLVTEGNVDIQQRKVDHLAIAKLFDAIVILDPDTEANKELAISRYMSARKISPSEAVIVGNRLDREIAAGNRLGIQTIWLRSGEGSEMKCDGVAPVAVIERLVELPSAIWTLVKPE